MRLAMREKNADWSDLAGEYFIGLTLIASAGECRIKRSSAALNAFRQAHPCPIDQRRRGPCPGWIIDHVVPLCAGGADDPANMQWQSRADSLVKDREEWSLCRALRRGRISG